jgi:SlyX protein
MSSLEARVDALETLAAHQERTIEELNQVIADQWKEIEALKRRLARLDDQLRDVEAGLPAPPNQRPPHY